MFHLHQWILVFGKLPVTNDTYIKQHFFFQSCTGTGPCSLGWSRTSCLPCSSTTTPALCTPSPAPSTPFTTPTTPRGCHRNWSNSSPTRRRSNHPRGTIKYYKFWCCYYQLDWLRYSCVISLRLWHNYVTSCNWPGNWPIGAAQNTKCLFKFTNCKASTLYFYNCL